MGGGGGSYASSSDDLTVMERLARQKLQESVTSERKNVFISFATEDMDEVNLLRGQAKNDASDLAFSDYSVKEPYDSENAQYIRDKIREKIRQSSVTLVFISDATSQSKWVDWEIRESKRLGKGIVAVYQGDTAPKKLPPAITEFKVKPITWTHNGIMKAVKKAAP